MINGMISPAVSLTSRIANQIVARAQESPEVQKALAAKKAQAAESTEDPAKDFEAVMLSILLSNMRKSSFGGEGLFPGDKSDTLGGLFDMMVSGQLADNGGLGLQQLITDWLAERQEQPTANLTSELLNASTPLR